MACCTRKELLSTKGEVDATLQLLQLERHMEELATQKLNGDVCRIHRREHSYLPSPSSSWLLDKKPFSLLQNPSSCKENSVKQNPEEFRNYMPITSWRCIQERTGQVIQLKNDFIATTTKSPSILFLKLVIATTQSTTHKWNKEFKTI